MAVSITKLKQQLMERIDTDNLAEVEKVERYIELVKSFRKVNRQIAKEGETIKVVNGSQEFTKAHPLINERSKINTQLINLEKSINFVNDAPSSSNEDEKRSSLI